MISEEMMKSLEMVRNIELCAKPNPDYDYLRFLDQIKDDEDLGAEYEHFMKCDDEGQWKKEAECVICQLKEFYKSRNWQVYEQESGVELIIRKYADPWYAEVWTDPDSGLLHFRIQIPIIIQGKEEQAHMARVLHNFNQDYEVGPGFFTLNDATGRMDYTYRQDFSDGSFTEDGFHRILNWCMSAVRKYYGTIRVLAD